jgi:predicted TIM-barrel fold metal-dependent hydrolase
MNMNRRRFLDRTARTVLGAAAAGTLGLAAADAQQSKEPAMADALPIVDTHQHLWDLSKLRLSWLKGAGALNRSYVMKDYLEATAGLNVVKAVYMEVDVDDGHQVAEAEYVLDICRRGGAPTCAAVIGGRPGEPGFREYITRYKGNPYIKGVRQVLFAWKEGSPFFLDKTYVDSIRLLGELGMSFDICVAAAGLADAAKLVDLCPDTRFILDHCGNADVKQFWGPSYLNSPISVKRMIGVPPDNDEERAARLYADHWRRGIAEMAKRKNVVCKISGVVATVPKRWCPQDLAPIINHCLDSFGPDRVIFGGDWPVCTKGATYRQWVEALRRVIHRRSEAEQRKLLAENAIKFYNLS